MLHQSGDGGLNLPPRRCSSGPTMAFLGVLPLHTAWAATHLVGGPEGEVCDVLLVVQADKEGQDVHHLLADPDVVLTDLHEGVMVGLGQDQFEDLGPQMPLQETLCLQAQDVIQPSSSKVPQQGTAFKQTPWVFLVQRQQLLGSLMDLGQRQFDPPDLTFVPGTILVDQLQLLIETGLLEGSLCSHGGFATKPALGHPHVGTACASAS